MSKSYDYVSKSILKPTCKMFPNYPCSRLGRAVTPCMVISEGYAGMMILRPMKVNSWSSMQLRHHLCLSLGPSVQLSIACLLYTSDAADDM
eukprot:540090-Rhodomonas_salina.1